MKKWLTFMLGTLIVMGLSTPTYALSRIVANFSPGGEAFSSVAPLAGGAGGTPFYSRTFFTDAFTDTLFIEVTGTADTHNGALNEVACLLDGAACRPEGFPSGWLVWQKTCGPAVPGCFGVPATANFDLHDNAVVARWCVQVPGDVPAGNLHTVNLKLASNPGGGANAAFLEQWNVTVDEEFTGGECTRP